MTDISKFCIARNSTIQAAMSLIQENHHRCICVVNEGRLCAVLSQGDIIKALFEGITPFTLIESIVSADVVYLHSRDMKRATELIRRTNITIIPVIDSDFRILDVITFNDVFDYLDSKHD